MLTWSASQVCDMFTKWLQGLPFQGPKCLQSLLASMEMLHASAHEQTSTLLTGACTMPQLLGLVWKATVLESPKSDIPLDSCRGCPQDLWCSSVRAHFNLSPAATPAVGMLRFSLMES